MWENYNYGPDYFGLFGGIRGAPLVGSLMDCMTEYIC